MDFSIIKQRNRKGNCRKIQENGKDFEDYMCGIKSDVFQIKGFRGGK